MKTKVNILDYFFYSNYSLNQYLFNKSKKYWILSPMAYDNPSDSVYIIVLCFYFILLKILSITNNGLNCGILEFSFLFILIIVFGIILYFYFKKTEKTILTLMKRKSRTKIIIGYICSLLFCVCSFYCLFTIK